MLTDASRWLGRWPGLVLWSSLFCLFVPTVSLVPLSGPLNLLELLLRVTGVTARHVKKPFKASAANLTIVGELVAVECHDE